MRIELKYPYSQDWMWGYTRIARDGRLTVDLYKDGRVRSCTSYARYLAACSIGRYLTVEEEADHMDGNPLNDAENNIQVLLIEDHKIKTKRDSKRSPYVTLNCKYCGESFEKLESLTKVKNFGGFCSRSCNGKFYWGKGIKRSSSTEE